MVDYTLEGLSEASEVFANKKRSAIICSAAEMSNRKSKDLILDEDHIDDCMEYFNRFVEYKDFFNKVETANVVLSWVGLVASLNLLRKGVCKILKRRH